MATHVEESDVLTRDQVAVEETWDLTTIYPDEAAWLADASRADDLRARAAAHRGKLGDSATELRAALDDVMAAQKLVSRLVTYAVLRRDEDTSDPDATARYQRAVAISTATGEALAFLEPEILAIPPERLADLAADPALAPYRHLLDDLQRHRPHVRSVEVEQLLAQSVEALRVPHDAFTALDNADLSYGKVRDETGQEVTLTKARHARLMESKDRDVRREAHEALSRAYLDHKHTLAALHGGSVRKDVFLARARGFRSAREAALFDTNVPEAVYDSLIAAVREARPTMERFLSLRRQALDLDHLALYDLRVPLAPTPQRRFTYPEAVETVLGALHPLGERYVADLGVGFRARWVDVHETKGKRSGAYSWGTYGAPPVILMNWNGTTEDVFTLAHEAGHAMHSFYANAAQPFHYAGYTIFLAEIASNLNEVLLFWHLLDQAPDDVERFALLNRFADGCYASLVVQTMYAEFEQLTHGRAEAGEPLTVETLNQFYGDLQAAYTPGLMIDDTVRVRWSRIPHFYRAFYVYQYATGLAAAIALARAIRDEGEPAAERYLAMLAAGGSDYSLPLLQRAGVDLTSPEPVRAALAEFDRTVAEMARLADTGILKASPGR